MTKEELFAELENLREHQPIQPVCTTCQRIQAIYDEVAELAARAEGASSEAERLRHVVDEVRLGRDWWAGQYAAAEAKVARAEALAEDWLTPREDHLGRPCSWWDEKPYGEELRAALDEGAK